MTMRRHVLQMCSGCYQMITCTVPVLVKKSKCITMETYDLLRNFHHDNSMPLLDYFSLPEQIEYGCFVIPEGSKKFYQWLYEEWLDDEAFLYLFDNKGHIAKLLMKLVIEFADLIGSLNKKNLVVKNLDVFIKDGNDSLPTLYILLTEVNKVEVLGAANEKCNWDHVRELMSRCEKRCGIKMDHLTSKFFGFIGTRHFTLEKLKLYPLDWDYTMKGRYLMVLTAGNHKKIGDALKDSDSINWPFCGTSRVAADLPRDLWELLEWQRKEKHREYEITSRFGYILFLRDVFKHHKKFPNSVKGIFKDQRKIIEQIEKWDPDFWIKIYERVGWPKVVS